MEIGFNGWKTVDDDEKMAELQDFGCGWIKDNFGLGRLSEKETGSIIRFEQPQVDELLHRAERLQEYGMRLVVDVRTTSQLLHKLPRDKLKEATEAGREEWEAATDVERRRLTRDRVKRLNLDIVDQIGQMTYDLVDQCKHIIKDWEWWGEHGCPHVTMGTLPSGDYSLFLSAFSDGAKQADPDCRVWNGGDGVQPNTNWLQLMVKPPQPTAQEHMWFPQGVGEYFDICNWHHYLVTMGPGNEDYGLSDVIAGYDKVFSESRELLDFYGKSQPFASTEWGLAMVDDAVLDALKDAQGRPILKSYTYTPGYVALPVSRSAEWFQACLDCFDRHKFEVLCVHSYTEESNKDTTMRNANHWGSYCGLKDIYGEKRPAWYVVRDWARAGYGTAFKGDNNGGVGS